VNSKIINSMSADELWSLHQQIDSLLSSKISKEVALLEGKLRELNCPSETSPQKAAKRPYPRVYPKYRNPSHPSETWAGRGMQPRWLTAQLRSGKKLDDFRIQHS